MRKELTVIDKLKLQNAAKAELERLETIANDESTSQKIDDFKRKFIICESVYKILLKKHQNDIKKTKNENLRIMIKQVKPALDYAGYPYDDNLFEKLFSTNRKVGERTIKSIRDALTHNLSQSAINELIDCEDELYGYMNQFLNMIRSYDN